MSSKVQICNAALLSLRGETITSLTDAGVPTAAFCNAWFDIIAEEVISSGDWTVASYRTTLARTSNTPAYGYSYEFQLPTLPRVFVVREINGDPTNSEPYRIEGDKLLINSSTVAIRYTGNVSSTESYSPLLRAAIIERLKAELVYYITGKTSMRIEQFQIYKDFLESALAIDGVQGSQDSTYSHDYVHIRNGSEIDEWGTRD